MERIFNPNFPDLFREVLKELLWPEFEEKDFGTMMGVLWVAAVYSDQDADRAVQKLIQALADRGYILDHDDYVEGWLLTIVWDDRAQLSMQLHGHLQFIHK